MILTGPAIAQAVSRGDLTIDPFDAGLVNPNSYNYRLGNELKVALDTPADPRAEARLETIALTDQGYLLKPRTVYLGSTVERIGSDRYVTSLIGRSSLSRLGCFLQISADLGQLGAVHQWTLEIVVVQPLVVYPGMRVGQVSFWDTAGAAMPYDGHYGTLSVPSPWSPRALSGSRHQEEAAA
ncbi:deoxycytidine deaminase [Streptomyces sp. NPDC048442]|uniref:dCTP deaminase n=1 Tax=Streptomyces sp. NPDC048442 TaxID=3154823 RepID=UPI0034339047